MSFFVEMIQFPFMQRAFLAGCLLALLLGWLGVYVITRQMSFIGDGVAHASLGAVALAILVGWAPVPTALIASIILGGCLYLLQKSSLSSDAAIGIIFTFGMAMGIILLQYHDGYVPELISFLFGSILSIGNSDLLLISIVGGLLLCLLAWKRNEFAFLAIDKNGAHLAGVQTGRIDLLFYVMVSLSIVLAIKLIGVILVSALLIIPSSIGKLLGTSFKGFEIIAIVSSFIIVLVGLTNAYVLDWPAGASIVVTGTTLLAFSALYSLTKQNV